MTSATMNTTVTKGGTRIKSRVRAGGIALNHNQAAARGVVPKLWRANRRRSGPWPLVLKGRARAKRASRSGA